MTVKKNIEYYMGLPYKMEIVPDEEGGYALYCPELPGCVTCADSIEEGVKLLEDARRCWIASCLESGREIPEPARPEDYSGQFRLRMPKTLHRRLAELARQEGVSMNQYCLYLLADRVR